MRIALTPVAACLLAACATTHPIEPQIAPASVDFASATHVEVALSNFEFTPETIRLTAGRPYALVLTSDGGHDFAAPEFFAAARIAAADAAEVADGKIDLKSGRSATIRLIPAVGEYGLVCTHLGHAAFGMKGRIVVS